MGKKSIDIKGNLYASRWQLKKQLDAALRDIQDSYFDGTSDEDKFRPGRKTIKDPDYAQMVKEQIEFLYERYGERFHGKELDYPVLYLLSEVKREIVRLHKEQRSLNQISMFPEEEKKRQERYELITKDVNMLERIKRMLVRGRYYLEPMYQDPPCD